MSSLELASVERCRGMGEQFWAAVGLAAAIATALATGVSTVAAIWWRRHDRTEADWLVVDGESWWLAPERGGSFNARVHSPQASARVFNAGDGTGFRVRTTGLGALVEAELQPVMGPGAEWRIRLWCEPSWWDEAEVLIEWIRSPTWRRKSHTISIPLSEIAPRPGLVAKRLNESTAQTETFPQPEPAPPVLPEELRSPPPPTKAGWPKRLWQKRTPQRAD